MANNSNVNLKRSKVSHLKACQTPTESIQILYVALKFMSVTTTENIRRKSLFSKLSDFEMQRIGTMEGGHAAKSI